MVFVPTNDYSYALTLRPRITLKTIDGATTLFTFNAFNSPSNPINMIYMDCEGAVGEMGTFNIIVEDSGGLIEKEDIHYCKVIIELGKSPTTFKYFLIGYADIFANDRPVTRYQEYRLTGFGSALQAYQLFLHKRQASKIQSIDNPTTAGDVDFNINKLFKSALEKRSWRPLRDKSIKDITGWNTTSAISSKVNINFPIVNAPFTYAGDFFDMLCNVSGAVWFIDYSTGAEIFTLSYNTDLHTGVVIKSGDLINRATDDATKTAYIKRAFSVEDNSTTEAGTASRLYTSTIIDQSSVSSAFVNKGSSTLDFKALAQQVIIDSDARRIDSLALVLSKVGEPESPKDRVNGDICLDNGHNSPRNGTILDTFEIGLGEIEDQPETIFINDLSVKEKLLEGGQKKIWIRLFQRSGITGDPTNDPNNTIRWHHNGVFNATPALALYSGQAVEGDRDKKEELDWKNTNLGPTYTYGIFSNIRRLQARTNEQAVQTLRLREQFVSTDFLSDPATISQYLSINLSQMSKARRSIADFQVTIPNDFIFRPYQIVSFNDGLSETFQDLQIKRVRYIISASQGDPQVGALHAEITLGGLYNSLLADCSCV